MEPHDCSVCCAPLMRLPALGKLAALSLCAAALAVAGCGEEGIEVAKSNSDYEGAELFVEHCSGCHTFSAAGTQGSATDVSSRENKDGPNFDQRKETEEDVIYAIENGGFSSGPMPQNIVVGDDANVVACFIASYSGRDAKVANAPGAKAAAAEDRTEGCADKLSE